MPWYANIVMVQSMFLCCLKSMKAVQHDKEPSEHLKSFLFLSIEELTIGVRRNLSIMESRHHSFMDFLRGDLTEKRHFYRTRVR